MSRAGAEIRANNIDAANLLKNERLSWAGHVARFGLDEKPPHSAKYLVSWRSLGWWRLQQRFVSAGASILKHVYPFAPRRWEDGLPEDWMNLLATKANENN